MTELMVEFYAGTDLCWEGIRNIEKMSSTEIEALVEHAESVHRQYCENKEFHGYAFLNRKKAAKIFIKDGRVVLDFCSHKTSKKPIRTASSNLAMRRKGRKR